MLVRQAHEIRIEIKGNTKTPFYWENVAKNSCLEVGYSFMGFVGEWSGLKTKALILCNNKHEYTSTLANIRKKVSCKKCVVDSQRLNLNRVIEIIKQETNDVFVGFVGGEYKNSRTRLIMNCANGHTYQPTYTDFIHKKTRCPLCNGGKIHDKENSLSYINENKGDYKFLGIIGEWKGTKTKLKFECPNNHIYEQSYDKFKLGRRCHKCSGTAPITKSDRLKQIEKICEADRLKFIGISGKWKGALTRILLTCEHNHEWVVTIDNFVNSGRRCPLCSKHGYQALKTGTLYIQKLTNNDSFVGVKFGITNKKTHERMRNQSRVSKFEHEIFYELTLQDGQKILDLENKIKEAMKGKTSYISKEDMPDGFTETVAPSELSTIMYIVKSFEKELTA